MTKKTISPLTARQFDALAELTGMHQSATRDALRMVLVDGATPVDAAISQGIKSQSVRNSLHMVRKKIQLAHIVAGQNTDN